MQQPIEYQEVGIQQLTQEGMGQLSAAGYGIAYQSVHNREILVFVRIAPQALPAPQEPPQELVEARAEQRQFTDEDLRLAFSRNSARTDGDE